MFDLFKRILEIFKPKHEKLALNTEKSKNEFNFGEIINAEDLRKFHQKTLNDSIDELNERVKKRRISFVDKTMNEIVKSSNRGCYGYRKRMKHSSMKKFYNYYELPKGDKGNGKEWIDSFVNSFKENGYKVEFSIEERLNDIKEVEIYISWR